MNHEINAHVIQAVYGNSDPRKGLSDGDDDPDILSGDENPLNVVAKAFDRARINHALGKAASIDGWDEELGDAAPAPKPAKDFVKSSDERFKKVSARIREIFSPHVEIAEEMIEAARKVRDEARAEIIASA
jgi:hypothetical protein